MTYPTQITNNDGLPTLICFQCVQQLNRSYTFRQQCERSDTVLRAWFQEAAAEQQNLVAANPQDHQLVVDTQQNLTESTHESLVSNSQNVIEQSRSLIDNELHLSPSSDTNHSKLELLLLEYTSGNLDDDTTAEQLPQAIFLTTTSHQSLSNEKKDELSSLVDEDPTKSFLNNDVLMTAANDVDAHLADNHEALINVEFLNDKMPVIPDDYIELMNSFVTANPDETEKLIEPPIIVDIAKVLEKPKRIPVNIDPESLVSCENCTKKFATTTALRRHRKTHNNPRIYICQYCSRQFCDSSALQKHIKRHEGKKPFLCSICSQTFYEESFLKVHMRTHTGERPYSCTECCKAFAQSCQLDRHKLIHNSIKQNVCEICTKGDRPKAF